MSEHKLAAISEMRQALRNNADHEALEGMFAVVTEDVLDAVEVEDREYLAGARQELRRTFAVLAARASSDIVEEPAFMLGRVTGLLELVGASAERQPSVEFTRQLENQDNKALLDQLRQKGELSSKELTERLGVHKSTVSRCLRRLEAAGVVICQPSGRQLYSRLSMAARDAPRPVDKQMKDILGEVRRSSKNLLRRVGST